MLWRLKACTGEKREERRGKERRAEAERDTRQEPICCAGGEGPVSRGEPRWATGGVRSGSWVRSSPGRGLGGSRRAETERSVACQYRNSKDLVGQQAAGKQGWAYSQGSQEPTAPMHADGFPVEQHPPPPVRQGFLPQDFSQLGSLLSQLAGGRSRRVWYMWVWGCHPEATLNPRKVMVVGYISQPPTLQRGISRWLFYVGFQRAFGRLCQLSTVIISSGMHLLGAFPLLPYGTLHSSPLSSWDSLTNK